MSLTPDLDTFLKLAAANPGKLIGAPVNYQQHLEEVLENPDLHHGNQVPVIQRAGLFLKATSSLAGAGDGITLRKPDRRTDHEVELAFVIGKRASYVSEADALTHVLGYMICNDVSERFWQLEGTGQWIKGKSAETFGPLGPWLVTTDEIKDPQDLAMKLKVNGAVRQKGSTSTMIFSIPFLLAYITQFCVLEPGDVVTCRAVVSVEVASDEDLPIGLQGRGVNSVVRTRTGVERGIRTTVGIEPDDRMVRRALIGEVASDEDLPIGLQGEGPGLVEAGVQPRGAGIEGRIQRSGLGVQRTGC